MKTDFIFHNEGTLIMLLPQTDQAQQWINENLQLDTWQNSQRPAIEPRMFDDICEGIRRDGLTIRGDMFQMLGQVVATRAVADQAAADAEYNDFIKNSLQRYIRCDWGDLCDEDKQLNDDAITEGENAGRVLSRYNNAKGDIYIITEADRSATTILHPSDY